MKFRGFICGPVPKVSCKAFVTALLFRPGKDIDRDQEPEEYD